LGQRGSNYDTNEENCILRKYVYNFCPSPNIAGDEIKDKKSRACETHAGVEGGRVFLQGCGGEA
jgi:hypothetical protein